MMRYATIGALLVALGLGGMLMLERNRVASLQAENASLTRSVAALERERAQAREAQAVARAEAERVAAKAREYDDIREAILKGDSDADLPDWFCEHLGRLGLLCATD